MLSFCADYKNAKIAQDNNVDSYCPALILSRIKDLFMNFQQKKVFCLNTF